MQGAPPLCCQSIHVSSGHPPLDRGDLGHTVILSLGCLCDAPHHLEDRIGKVALWLDARCGHDHLP